MRFRFTLYNATEGTHVLPTDPKGWDTAEILLKRGQKYHGVVTEYSIKLDFHYGAGKEFIDDVYNAQGPEAEITIDIDIDVTGSWEDFYDGVLDLSTWENKGIVGRKDSFTSVNIIDRTVANTVISRFGTKVDLTKLETLDGTALSTFTYAPYDLTLHSKVLRLVNKQEYNSTAQNVPTAGIGATPRHLYIQPAFDITINEYDTFQTADGSYSFATTHIMDGALFGESANQTYTLNYSLVGSFTESNSQSRDYSVQLFIGLGSGAQYTSLVDINTLLDLGTFSPAAGVDNTQNFNVSGSVDVTLNTTTKTGIFFQWRFYDFTNSNPGPTESTVSFTYTDGYLEVLKDSTVAATDCKAFAVHEVGARIAQYITNQTDAFRSDYFGRTNSQPVTYASNGCGSKRAIVTGSLIRNFPIADRPPFISMDEYFEGLNAIDNLGLSIEPGPIIRIEPKSYYYSTDVLMRISNIPDWEVTVAKEYFYNHIEIGYEKWETETTNGIDEFNSKRQYTLPLKKFTQALNIYSKFVAGGYAIEETRRKQYIDGSSEDFEYDNNLFIICLDPDNANLDTCEKNGEYSAVNNIISPETAYNLRISPARNLIRWNNVIGAGLKWNPNSNIKFTYGEGNYKMSSQFTSDSCVGSYNNALLEENQNLRWDSEWINNRPLWIPEYYEFEYPLSFSEYKYLKGTGSDGKLNTYRCLEISRSTDEYIKAYIIEIGYAPVKGLAKFKLLRANV